MPTVLRAGPYRFFFYSGDGLEPPHVHAERDDGVAKFWLEPVRYDGGVGFGPLELRRLETIVAANREQLLRRWHEFFGE